MSVNEVVGRIETIQARFLPPPPRTAADGFPATLDRASGSNGVRTGYRLDAASGPAEGGAVVGTALQYLGVPYVWGGESPAGFDCSGFVQYVFGRHGVDVPRVSRDQAQAGEPVAREDIRPGDLVFFGRPVDHVGIYSGDGKMVVAPKTGDVVKVQTVDFDSVTAIRRVLPSAASAVPAATSGGVYGAAGAGNTLLGAVEALATRALGNGAGRYGSGSLTGGATLGTAAEVYGADSLAGAAALSGLAGTPGTTGTAAGAGAPAWAERLPAAGRAWAGAIEQAATAAGVDPALLASLTWAESGFNPSARSSAGAIGLTQLMPGTARGLGVDPTDPVQNLAGGARYLAAQLDRFGSPDLALAAYNAGPGAVSRAGGIPPYAETRAYVARVLDRYQSLTA